MQAEMRRERGADESVQQYHARLAQQIAEGADPEEVGKETPFFVRANREAAEMTMYQRLYEQAKAIDPDSVAALDSFAEQENLTAEQWRGISQAAMNAVANSSTNKGKSDAYNVESLDDIPKDSPLWRLIDAQLTHERESEMNAQQIEAAQKPNPPLTPQGAATVQGRTPQDIAAMTDKQMDAFVNTLSSEEFDQVMSDMIRAGKSGA